MNKSKKLLALTLALLMLLSLTACGGFEMRMARAAARMGRLESVHSETSITADVNLSLFGSETSMAAGVELSADVQKEPALADAELRADLMGTARTIRAYVEKSGENAYTVYLSGDGGHSWETRELTLEGELKPDLTGQLQTLAGLAAAFTEVGRETIHGVSAVTYAGEIPAELVQQAIESGKLREKLEDALKTELEEDCFADVGAIPMTISVSEKTSDILRVTMDLTDAVGGVLSQVMSRLLADSGMGLLDGLGLEMRVDNVQLTTELSEFNSVSVEIPAEAKG